MTRLPSVQTLSDALFPRCWYDDTDAKARGRRVREALEYARDGEGALRNLASEVQAWKDGNSRDRRVETALALVNEITGGHGVESLRAINHHVDNFWYDCVALYVNQGDTYYTTLLYDVERRSFVVTSWGDFVETCENRRRYKFA